ncbi:hypothetical protein KAZ57_00970 [Patescibacteria group bacterium]|nr:hypothetical protein [Patescibacteria group bacterium]
MADINDNNTSETSTAVPTLNFGQRLARKLNLGGKFPQAHELLKELGKLLEDSKESLTQLSSKDQDAK